MGFVFLPSDCWEMEMQKEAAAVALVGGLWADFGVGGLCGSGDSTRDFESTKFEIQSHV
jgi:hypothetical protein